MVFEGHGQRFDFLFSYCPLPCEHHLAKGCVLLKISHSNKLVSRLTIKSQVLKRKNLNERTADVISDIFKP